MKLTILIKLTDAIVGLGQVVKTVEVEDRGMVHMETREPRQDPDVVTMEVHLTVEVRVCFFAIFSFASWSKSGLCT